MNTEILVRLAVATLLGAVIGFERENMAARLAYEPIF